MTQSSTCLLLPHLQYSTCCTYSVFETTQDMVTCLVKDHSHWMQQCLASMEACLTQAANMGA